MALIGTLLAPQFAVSAVNGLTVANQSFLEALVLYSGRFKTFHFFCDDASVEVQQESWDGWLDLKKTLDRATSLRLEQVSITVYPVLLLPSCLSNFQYDAFHCGDPFAARLLDMRESYAGTLFPVTARIHGLCHDVSLSSWCDLLQSGHKACDAFLCSSQPAKQALENILALSRQRLESQSHSLVEFRGEKYLLPLGVCERFVVNPITRTQRQVDARHYLGLPEAGHIILALGRFSPNDKMDLHPLIQAFSELADRYGHEDCWLYLCGPADDSDDYIFSLARHAGEAGLEERLLFNFELSNEERPLAYQAADVFVSIADSPQESFGLTVIEAMASACPVVASDWNGYRNLVDDGVTGFLIPTLWGDVDGLIMPAASYEPARSLLAAAQSVSVDTLVLTERLNQLLESFELRDLQGKAGLKRVQRDFRWPDIVAEYDELSIRLKAIADAERFQASGCYSGLGISKAFGHYSSRQLSDDCWLRTTPAGRQLLGGNCFLSRFDGLSHLVHESLLRPLLERALVSVQLKILYDLLEPASAHIRYLVLWAVKHGLLFPLKDQPACSQIKSPETLGSSESAIGSVVEKVMPLASDFADMMSLKKSLNFHLSNIYQSYYGLVESFSQSSGVDIETVKSFPLWQRLLKRQALFSQKAVHRLFIRLKKQKKVVSSEFDIPINAQLLSIEPLGRLSLEKTLLLTFSSGEKLIYKPVDSRMTEMLTGKQGLSEVASQWLAEKTGAFAEPMHHMTADDRWGSYSFRYYIPEVGEIPGTNAPESSSDFCRNMGMLSGFALLSGLSDLHLDNVCVVGDKPCLLDTEMANQQAICQALLIEAGGELPDSWQDCSLAKTRIELFWKDWLQEGNTVDVVAVCDGFRDLVTAILNQGERWLRAMVAGDYLPVREDLMPLVVAEPLLLQLQNLDLFCECSLEGLMTEAKVLATRGLRQCDSLENGAAKELAKSWVRGEHLESWHVPHKQGKVAISDAIKALLALSDSKQLQWVKHLQDLYGEFLATLECDEEGALTLLQSLIDQNSKGEVC